MKELFVTYELALLSKEKKFSIPCFGGYSNTGGLKITPVSFQSDIDGFCLAPLYQQIIDWFRETHEIEIWVTPELGYTNTTYTSHIIGDKISSNYFSRFKTPREALDKVIEEGLKLI